MYRNVATDIGKFRVIKPQTIVPIPTEKDYKRGYIERFFTRLSFDQHGFVYEINQVTFEKYSNNSLWTTERMYWRITGPLEPVYNSNTGMLLDKGVLASNRASIAMASLKIKNISLYLPNILQFHRE